MDCAVDADGDAGVDGDCVVNVDVDVDGAANDNGPSAFCGIVGLISVKETTITRTSLIICLHFNFCTMF